MSASALLHIERLRKRFTEQPVLDIAQFSIAPARAYVLTGKNGSGKSLFMRILAGLESAEDFSWSFMGQSYTDAASSYPAQLRKSIIYVHQHPYLLDRSVEDNICYGMRVQHYASADIKARLEEALSWADLTALRHRKPQGLSGGEKQRVALARVKVLQPRLLLLDEPSANLDGQAREQVIALIPTLVAQGVSVVVACHDRDLLHLDGVQHLKLREGRITLRTHEGQKR